MNKITLFPCAKINLGLNITRKRSDGYHDLETVFCPVPIADILTIEKNGKPAGCSLKTNGIVIDGRAKRLAPAVIPNDGKQTPMRGHPVFLAQHATGCCCRCCFFKWHHIPAGRALTKEEQEYAVAVLMAWIEKQMDKG